MLIRVVVLKDDVMKKWIFGLTFMVFLSGCREEKQKLALGSWLMELQVMDHQKLPFNFKLAQDKEIIIDRYREFLKDILKELLHLHK